MNDETRNEMPEDVYDFWPWPGVGLLNDKPWPDGVVFLPTTHALPPREDDR